MQLKLLCKRLEGSRNWLVIEMPDSEQLAAMIDNVSSVDNLDFIMESDALGHTVMDQRQEVLEFISDFGKPSAIVACVPKKVYLDGIGETEFKNCSRRDLGCY